MIFCTRLLPRRSFGLYIRATFSVPLVPWISQLLTDNHFDRSIQYHNATRSILHLDHLYCRYAPSVLKIIRRIGNEYLERSDWNQSRRAETAMNGEIKSFRMMEKIFRCHSLWRLKLICFFLSCSYLCASSK